MTTTAVFAEILVVGLQAAAWIALAVLAVFGTSWVDLEAVDKWATLVTILVLATAYVLGIVVDRMADSLVHAVIRLRARGETRKARKTENGVASEFQRKRLEVLHRASEGMAKFLDYQRSRLRVARGTIFNALCATAALFAFLALQTDASVGWLVAAIAAGLAVVAAAVYANERIYSAYSQNLDHAYQLIRE